MVKCYICYCIIKLILNNGVLVSKIIRKYFKIIFKMIFYVWNFYWIFFIINKNKKNIYMNNESMFIVDKICFVMYDLGLKGIIYIIYK